MKAYVLLIAIIITTGCEAQKDNSTDPGDKYLERLLSFDKEEDIKGLAFAIFNNKEILWQHCIGKSTYGYPIDDKTLFSIQSVSKNITALAVMIAVQDSLLDLDLPVSEYLPGFRINSCFEDEPLDKITLRMLLNHTSGLTHEAPVGNNYDYNNCTFYEHLKSISNTWLKFPVLRQFWWY